MPPIITLLTDFGLEDSYVAEMKGVLLSLAPEATLVDITHLVPPQDVLRGALVLSSAASRFPPGAVHLAVVDPGVGTARRAVAVEAGGHRFVGPDNGLLSLALHRAGAFAPSRARTGAPSPRGQRPTDPSPRRLRSGVPAIELTNPEFWLPAVSPTFHGRDIFAPVAARLARGAPLAEAGKPLRSLLAFRIPRPRRGPGGGVRGEVIAVDRFGNLVTSLRTEDLHAGGEAAGLVVEVAGRSIDGLSRTYEEREGLMALVAGAGYLEIAVAGGSAAQELGAGTGTEVVVRRVR